jgi:hypothetical protein
MARPETAYVVETVLSLEELNLTIASPASRQSVPAFLIWTGFSLTPKT